MLELRDIQSRLPRLRQLIDGFSQEYQLWKRSESPLLPLEAHRYLVAVHEAILSLDKGLLVLEKAEARIRTATLPEPGRVSEAEFLQ